MEVRDEALGVIPGRTASSADLGGSELTAIHIFRNKHANSSVTGSKYSNENFED